MRKTYTDVVMNDILSFSLEKQKLLCSFCKALARADENEAESIIYRFYSFSYKKKTKKTDNA